MVTIIVLATRNAGKVKEFQEMLKDFPVEIKNLNDFGPIPEVEEDGDTDLLAVEYSLSLSITLYHYPPRLPDPVGPSGKPG